MKTHLAISVVSGGRLVEVLRLKIENPEKATEDDITDAISQIRKMLYEGDRIHLSNEDTCMVMRAMAKNPMVFQIKAIEVLDKE